MVETERQIQTIDFGEEYPGAEIPTIFADGVRNMANSPYIVKFYFYRLDPNVQDSQKAQVRTCAQAVLPIDGFINMYAFFERAIQQLQTQGIVVPEDLQAARKAQVDQWTA
jgi:hypothetical protein